MRCAIYFVTVSTLLHLSWLYIVYELYFVQPPSKVSYNMSPQYHNLKPPADRVIMFAIKGLTLNYTYQLHNDKQSYMPFTRSIICRQGRWGVSHLSADIGTISNNKNIYLAGVTQEDCHGVTTVCYDDIVNASSRAWIWSCDGDMHSSSERVESNIHRICREERINCSMYISWMLNDIEDLILIQSNKKTVANKLSDTKSIFLFNMDVSNCSVVQEDLIVIDQMINHTTDLINSYFNDSRTATLLFGTPGSNQMTDRIFPFVAWGAGIRQPRSAQYGTYRYDDDLSSTWNLEKFERIDLDMINIVPLVAVLLGTRIPVHSEGIIPHGYIHYNKEFLAETLLLNVKQFLEKVQFKEEDIKSQSLSMLFRPYKSLTDSYRKEAIRKMEVLISDRKLQEVIEHSLKMIQLCKEALSYYNTYHQLSLQFSITLTFMGWIVYSLSLLLKEGNHCLSMREGMPSIPCLIISSLLFLVLQYKQSLSLVVFVWYGLPILCWDLAIRNSKHILRKMRNEFQNVDAFIVNMVVQSAVIIALEVMFLGIVHHYVWLLTLVLPVAVAGLAPFVKLRNDTTFRFWIMWISLCLTLGCYPLLPNPVAYLNNIVSFSSGLSLIAFHIYLLSDSSLQYRFTIPRIRVCLSFNMLLFDTVLCLIAFPVVIVSEAYDNTILNCSLQQPAIILSWVILLVSVTSLFLGPKSVPGRLLHVCTNLYIIFIVVSGFNCSVFILALICLLFCTLYMADITSFQNENSISLWDCIFGCVYYSEFPPRAVTSKCPKLPSKNEFYRAGYLLLLVFVTMAALVNIDDISSNIRKAANSNILLYSAPSVTNLLSVIVRLIVPLICIYSTFSVIVIKLDCTLENFFCSAYLLVDILALQVFLVTGTSIHILVIYIMLVSNALLFPFLYMLARIITGDSIMPRKACDKK